MAKRNTITTASIYFSFSFNNKFLLLSEASFARRATKKQEQQYQRQRQRQIEKDERELQVELDRLHYDLMIREQKIDSIPPDCKSTKHIQELQQPLASPAPAPLAVTPLQQQQQQHQPGLLALPLPEQPPPNLSLEFLYNGGFQQF